MRSRAALASVTTAAVATGWIFLVLPTTGSAQQDVPISLTAVSAEELSLRGVPDFTDLQRRTLSLTLQVSRGGSAAYRGDVNFFETPVPAIDQEAYMLYDAGVVWTSPEAAWRVGLYGRNLADEPYRTGGYVFPGALFNESMLGFYGPPRTIRASLEFTF